MMAEEIYNPDTKIHKEHHNFDTSNKENLLVELMDLYGQEVVWIAYGYVKDAGIAEDLTQEVFIKCYQSIDQFRSDSSVKTWIFRIAINTCKDYLRSAYVRRIFPTHLISNLNKAAAPSPETITIARNESKVLTQKVLSLPKKYREIIMLHYFQELKVKEVAEVLNMNMNTVKTRLKKGKQLLKTMLDENLGGPSNGK